MRTSISWEPEGAIKQTLWRHTLRRRQPRRKTERNSLIEAFGRFDLPGKANWKAAALWRRIVLDAEEQVHD